jgi:hypothetical protein
MFFGSYMTSTVTVFDPEMPYLPVTHGLRHWIANPAPTVLAPEPDLYIGLFWGHFRLGMPAAVHATALSYALLNVALAY